MRSMDGQSLVVFGVEVLAIYTTFILPPPFTFVAVSKIAVYTENGAAALNASGLFEEK